MLETRILKSIEIFRIERTVVRYGFELYHETDCLLHCRRFSSYVCLRESGHWVQQLRKFQI